MLVFSSITEAPNSEMMADAKEMQDFIILQAMPLIQIEVLKKNFYRNVRNLVDVVDDIYTIISNNPSYHSLCELYHNTSVTDLDINNVTTIRSYTFDIMHQSMAAGQFVHDFGGNVLVSADLLLNAFKTTPVSYLCCNLIVAAVIYCFCNFAVNTILHYQKRATNRGTDAKQPFHSHARFAGRNH